MRINVSRVINGAFTDPITVVRASQDGVFVKGIYAEGKAAQFDIEASIQPFQTHEFQALPEGVRENEWVWVYTRTQLKGTEPKRPGDVLLYRGERWRVERVEEWEHAGYTRAMATKMKGP